MVEMRWLERWVDDTETRAVPVSGGQPLKRMERVLQYRLVQTVIDWHGKAGGIPRQEWTAWKDVPTETFSAASKTAHPSKAKD